MLFLIDYENVGNAGMRGCACLNEQDHVVIFYSDAMKNMEQRFLEDITVSGCVFEICRLCKTGKNALDFYIASRLGEMAGNGYDGIAVIISRDSGFQAVQDYWANRALHRRRILLASCVEDGIVKGNENNERTKELKRQRMSLSIGSYYSAYMERMRMKHILQNLFRGTEYEGLTAEILCLIENKPKAPRTIYLNSLHAFGKKDGLAIYQMIKGCPDFGKELSTIKEQVKSSGTPLTTV